MISFKALNADVVRVTLESTSCLVSANFAIASEAAPGIAQRYLEASKEIGELLDQVRSLLTKPKPSSK